MLGQSLRMQKDWEYPLQPPTPPPPHTLGRNDPWPKRLTAETTHQNRPNRLTQKFGRNDPRPKRPGFRLLAGMNTWGTHFIFPLTKKFVNIYLKKIDYKNKRILHQYSNLPKRPTAQTTQSKRPTKIGWIDSPQNKVETTRILFYSHKIKKSFLIFSVPQ